jgi:glutathione synthase/RimK-type ligase-like ATP-grasp enzyme
VILVCGEPDDKPVAMVLAGLHAGGHPHRVVDLSRYPSGYTVEWMIERGVARGWIACADWRLDLADVRGVYARYTTSLAPDSHEAALPSGLRAAASMEAQAGVAVMLEHLPCRVVNRHDAGLANTSKPYQSRLIRAAGFSVPESLVTTDVDAAEAFYHARRGQVIVKPLSGYPSIVRYVEPGDLGAWRAALTRPLYLQTYVPGDNIRVHVVGEQVFATLCASDAVDYRYPAAECQPTRLRPRRLPRGIQDACRRLNDASGLLMSGIDLKRTPEGEYYCFEINPAPVFSWYEAQTNQPISSALISLLMTV